MNKKIVFFSDLDRTLIYSKKFLKDSIDSVCIETKGEKEISYMTKEAVHLLREVKSQLTFIPVSTRTYETMTRVSFIEEDIPEWMICDNGAHIYHHGMLLDEWEVIMQEKSASLKVSITTLKEKVVELFKEQRLKEVFNREDLYLMLKFEEVTGEIRGMLEILNLELREYGFRMDINSRKAYILPDFVRKEDAVTFLVNREGYEHTVSAGDTFMDYGMLQVTKEAIAPKHKTFDSDTIKLTEAKGLLAGEEILQFIASL